MTFEGCFDNCAFDNLPLAFCCLTSLLGKTMYQELNVSIKAAMDLLPIAICA